MSGIDWDKAPEGANYAAIASDGKLIAWLVDVAEPITGRNVAARPSVVWVGEALPPAGTACEYNASSDHDKGKELWCEVFIKYLSEWVIVFECTKAPAGHEASVGVELFGDISERIEKRFRPIRTPEQIAADEREAAVAEMTEVTQGARNWPEAFGKLHDAGYCKQANK